MQPTICKYLILVMVCLALNTGLLWAQFIRVNIKLPAGIDLMIKDNNTPKFMEPPPVELDTFTAGGGHTPANMKVRWMELRSRENSEIIFQLQRDSRLEAFGDSLLWLNNGTNNFNMAMAIPNRWVGRFLDGLITKKQMPKTYTFFSAWLGIPLQTTGVLSIEYH